MIILYLIGAFIAFYISHKLYYHQAVKKAKNKWYNDITDYWEFWVIPAITIFYPVIVPGIILWKLMDIIYIKITNKFN